MSIIKTAILKFSRNTDSTQGAIADAIGSVFSVNEKLNLLDSKTKRTITADGADGQGREVSLSTSLTRIIEDAIARRVDSGQMSNGEVENLADAIESSLDVIARMAGNSEYLGLANMAGISGDKGQLKLVTADSITADGVNTLQGSELLATVAMLNMYKVIQSSIPYITGNVTGLEAVQTKGNTSNKWRVYSTQAVTQNEAGDLASGTLINSVNAGSVFASDARRETIAGDNTATTYTFNLKNKSTDVANYAMERGSNSVEIPFLVDINNGNAEVDVKIDDFDVSKNETTANRTFNIGVESVTAVFNYTAGTIVVTITDATMCPTTTNLYFTGQLSQDTVSETTGYIATDITHEEYVSHPTRVGTSINYNDLRNIQDALGMDAHGNGLLEALRKITVEDSRTIMTNFYKLAKPITNLADLTNQGSLAQTTEIYKNFEVALETTRKAIQDESFLGGKLVVFGGSGAIDIFIKATTRTDNSTMPIDSDENGIRFIGNLRSNGTQASYPMFYDPIFDTLYPVVDNGDGTFTHKIVVGIAPSNPTQKPVLVGIAKPIIPIVLGVNGDLKKATVYEGELINDANKNRYSRQLVRVLTVKIGTPTA